MLNIISWEMIPTSIGTPLKNKLVLVVGVNPPADMTSGRAQNHCPVDNGFAPTETECRLAEVRSRSMSCNCMTRTSQQECRGILEQWRRCDDGRRDEAKKKGIWLFE